MSQQAPFTQTEIEQNGATILSRPLSENLSLEQVFGAIGNWLLQLGPYHLLYMPIHDRWLYWDWVHETWQDTGHKAFEVEFFLDGDQVKTRPVAARPAPSHDLAQQTFAQHAAIPTGDEVESAVSAGMEVVAAPSAPETPDAPVLSQPEASFPGAAEEPPSQKAAAPEPVPPAAEEAAQFDRAPVKEIEAQLPVTPPTPLPFSKPEAIDVLPSPILEPPAMPDLAAEIPVIAEAVVDKAPSIPVPSEAAVEPPPTFEEPLIPAPTDSEPLSAGPATPPAMPPVVPAPPSAPLPSTGPSASTTPLDEPEKPAPAKPIPETPATPAPRRMSDEYAATMLYKRPVIWELRVIEGPQAAIVYRLKPLTTVGRSSDNVISLDDPMASRHHSRLEWAGDNYIAVDLGSSNGTFVNDQRISSPTVLNEGDQLLVGQTKFIVQKHEG